MPYGGFVIRTGESGTKNKQKVEFQPDLENNPGFTSSILVAYVRAAIKFKKE